MYRSVNMGGGVDNQLVTQIQHRRKVEKVNFSLGPNQNADLPESADCCEILHKLFRCKRLRKLSTISEKVAPVFP